MIVQPGDEFEATVTNGPPGLVGTLLVSIEDGQGNEVVAAHTTGIVESPAGSGVYTATLTAPATTGQFIVVFDTGDGDEDTDPLYAVLLLEVAAAADPDDGGTVHGGVTVDAGFPFELTVDNFPTGLVGTIGARLENGQGGVTIARATTGIVESPAGSGIYTARMTAPADDGQYVAVLDTGGVSPTYAAFTVTVLEAGARPTIQEVAALLRARTKANGQERGTFDAETRPTGSEVDDYISMASAYVLARVGTGTPSNLILVARYATALRTAMLIEMSYWPEQAQESGSLYQMLTETFDTHMAGLMDNLADINQGADHRIGTIGVTSPTLAAYEDVYGIDLNEDLLG